MSEFWMGVIASAVAIHIYVACVAIVLGATQSAWKRLLREKGSSLDLDEATLRIAYYRIISVAAPIYIVAKIIFWIVRFSVKGFIGAFSPFYRYGFGARDQKE